MGNSTGVSKRSRFHKKLASTLVMLPFESKSMSNHTESVENWNKRGAGRVKANSLQILNVCGLLKLNCPPSGATHPIAHWRVSTRYTCSKMHYETQYEVSH